MYLIGKKANAALKNKVSSKQKNEVLGTYIYLIKKNKKLIISRNKKDLEFAIKKKLKSNLIERLRIDEKKISNIINIGGNGTLQQSIDLSSKLPELNFVSCPKTVDNDLGDINFNKMLTNPGFISSIYIWKFFIT